MNDETFSASFKSRARLLQHLGDQLIGTPRLAVFELVKNAYDADASFVTITINGIGTKNTEIVIEDDGDGMSPDTIRDIWLVIAHDHREKQLKAKQRTAKGRLPLGSKGLGRLSVHKLGNQIELTTKAENEPEVHVKIDWNNLIENEFLEDAVITFDARTPKVFTENTTGTRIRINDLRDKRWTRGEIRRLYRQITSISSPFGTAGRDDFDATLSVPGFPGWIENLPDPEALLERAPWKFQFEFDGVNFRYNYSFKKITGIARESREVTQQEEKLLIPPAEIDDDDPLLSGVAQPASSKRVAADNEMLSGIGPVKGEFYAFDLSPRVANRMGEVQLIKNFLDENGGIRVYRDSIRVYDYGERHNDWLGLDLKRVNNPTKGLSRNIVVGHVSINQNDSWDLVEKSNREGFIENDAYERFRRIVLGAIAPLQREREIDRQAIRKLTGEASNPEAQSILEPIGKIRKIALKNNLSSKVDPLLDRIEAEYQETKERLLSAGISGTSLAVVFHEIEQGIRVLYKNIEDDPKFKVVAAQVLDLMRLLDGFSDLLRKKDRKPHDVKSIIRRARDLSVVRFRHHNVKLVCPALDSEEEGPIVSCSFGLTVGALVNLIDNALFWLNVRWEDNEDRDTRKTVYLDLTDDLENGPAIVVADNGTGFQDEPGRLVQPFYSRRPAGMGMGLYYANMVMELNGGALEFPDHSDVELPDEFDGAVVALSFGNAEAG